MFIPWIENIRTKRKRAHQKEESFHAELGLHDLLLPALTIWFATRIGVEHSKNACSPEIKMKI